MSSRLPDKTGTSLRTCPRIRLRTLSWIKACLLFLSCTSTQQENLLHISAASSLQAPVEKIRNEFQVRHPEARVLVNLAASSILAKQIEKGAPADVFISASPEWIEYLAKHDLLDTGIIAPIARNELVIVVKNEVAKPQSLSDLSRSEFQPIAVGDPSHVPVGIYARQALEAAGLWDKLAPVLLPTLEATATIATVARGEAPVGIAYRNEIYERDDIQIAFTIPDSLQPDIVYEAAILKASSNKQLAEGFFSFLLSERGQEIFAEFQLLPPTKK